MKLTLFALSGRQSMAPEPRIRVVPSSAVKTAGGQVTRVAQLGGISLDESQQQLARDFSAVDAQGHWSAFEAVVMAPRQNLKTEYLLARILAGLFVFDEQLIVYSAHQARTTAKTFGRLKRAIGEHPALGGRIARVSNRSGAEQIELTDGRLVECAARSTQSGRGYTGDCLILDEAHELDADQLAAVLPALSTVRNPQVIYALSMGNQQSTHLGQLRARALSGQDPHVAWVEWSMAEGDRVDDPEVWARCNPAYPERISMDYLQREYLALGPERFAVERLGKSAWPMDESGRYAVISREDWEACEMTDCPLEDPVAFGVAVSMDGRTAAIVACGSAWDGIPCLEVVDHRPAAGCGWVGARLRQLVSAHETSAVLWDDSSMAGPLSLAGYVGDVQVLDAKPAELAQYCGGLFYAAQERKLRHRGHFQLTSAVGAARVRPSRAAWYWDSDGLDAEVLIAATWALAAHEQAGGVAEPGVWVM